MIAHPDVEGRMRQLKEIVRVFELPDDVFD